MLSSFGVHLSVYLFVLSNSRLRHVRSAERAPPPSAPPPSAQQAQLLPGLGGFGPLSLGAARPQEEAQARREAMSEGLLREVTRCKIRLEVELTCRCEFVRVSQMDSRRRTLYTYREVTRTSPQRCVS